jgi:hypothetical protein
VLGSARPNASLESGALDLALMRADANEPRVGGRRPLALVYSLWLGSWETARSALAAASRSGTLSASEAAAHKALIAAERTIVIEQLTLLVGDGTSAGRSGRAIMSLVSQRDSAVSVRGLRKRYGSLEVSMGGTGLKASC